jgi:hypothetical protein
MLLPRAASFAQIKRKSVIKEKENSKLKLYLHIHIQATQVHTVDIGNNQILINKAICDELQFAKLLENIYS